MPIPNTAEETIAYLNAPDAKAVKLGRVVAVAVSGDPDVAERLARERAEHPVYTAKCGPISTSITTAAFLSLKNLGADCPPDLF